jgi:hypothetical protein
LRAFFYLSQMPLSDALEPPVDPVRKHASPELERLATFARRAATRRSDFHQHVEMVTEMARQVMHLTEMGVRGGVSTNGWLYGMASAHAMDGRRRTFVGYDLDLRPFTRWCNAAHRELCKRAGVDVELHKGNVLDMDMEVTNLLFIDTLHVYGQLKRELAKHASRVTWRIVLHDTTIDGVGGECARLPRHYRSLAKRLHRRRGWTEGDTHSGLMRAVHEFLDAHPDEWVLVDQWTHNNGLTILQRIPGTFDQSSAGGGGGGSSDAPSDAAAVEKNDAPVMVGVKRAAPDTTTEQECVQECVHDFVHPLLTMEEEEDAALP